MRNQFDSTFITLERTRSYQIIGHRSTVFESTISHVYTKRTFSINSLSRVMKIRVVVGMASHGDL